MALDDEPTLRRDKIVGDYIIVRRLTAGGFGTVFEARHRDTQLTFALKRLPLTPEDAERFRKEALYPASVAARSLHVMGVHSFFKDPDGDFFYVVTELVPNGDLRDFLKKHAPLDVRMAADTAVGIARGLVAIHEQGIVHLDLKPRNVLMDQKDGRWVPKITDFGLARSGGSLDLSQSASVGYAAPEQWDLRTKPGPDSDLFAFGMILYELLTGRPATEATDREAYAAWLDAGEPPAAPSAVRPELARWGELDALTAALLQFDRTRRTATAADALRVLTGALARIERAADAPGASQAPVPAPPGRSAGSAAQTASPPARAAVPSREPAAADSRVRQVALIAGSLMALVVLLLYLGRDQASSSPPETRPGPEVPAVPLPPPTKASPPATSEQKRQLPEPASAGTASPGPSAPPRDRSPVPPEIARQDAPAPVVLPSTREPERAAPASTLVQPLPAPDPEVRAQEPAVVRTSPANAAPAPAPAPPPQPLVSVSYEAACGNPLQSPKGTIESLVREEVRRRRIGVKEPVRIVVGAGILPQNSSGSGAAVSMRGQFFVCSAASPEGCAPSLACPAPCTFRRSDSQNGNREEAADALAEAIAISIGRDERGARNACQAF